MEGVRREIKEGGEGQGVHYPAWGNKSVLKVMVLTGVHIETRVKATDCTTARVNGRVRKLYLSKSISERSCSDVTLRTDWNDWVGKTENSKCC